MIAANTELFGRKTFFMAADSSLIPQERLEEFMSQGVQAYTVVDDASCPMQTKIQEIVKLYPDAILYFNIDSRISGLEWQSYLKELQSALGEKNILGVFYTASKNSAEENSIRSYYINSLHFKGGCFNLSQNNSRAFSDLLAFLEVSGAKGRRNLVRAQCDKSSQAKFKFRDGLISADVIDINASYFRCDLNEYTKFFSDFEKVRDVELSINGITFLSDAVLIMKRSTDDKILCIFMFIKRDDSPDLDEESARLLNQKIYQIAREENMAELNAAFRQAI